MKPGLSFLLEPRSVAVVGASDRGDKPGARISRVLTGSSFDGPMYGINPRPFRVPGMTSLRSVADLPQPVDLAVLAVGAEHSVAALDELADRKLARSAIVFSSGFSEAGADGDILQARLAEIARRNGLPLCGPNTAGIISMPSGFVGSFTHAIADGLPPSGSVMVITQSGAIGGVLLTRLREAGVGISHWVSVGNGATLSLTDYLEFGAEDTATASFVLFVEGLDDGDAFRRAAETCRQAGKPVVAYKVGSTLAGATAARSHTGKVAGSHRIYEGLFRQTGIATARSLLELTTLAMTHSWSPAPRGQRVAILSVSGAGCTALADETSNSGLVLAEFGEETRKTLSELLPGFAQRDNPVDLTGAVLEELERLRGVLLAVLDDPAVDLVLLSFATNNEPEIAATVVDAWDRSKPLGVVLPVSLKAGDRMHRVLSKNHVPTYNDFPDAASAFGSLLRAAHFGTVWPKSGSGPVQMGGGSSAESGRRSEMIHPSTEVDAASQSWIGWDESAALLESYGVTVARTGRAAGPDEAAALASGWGVERVVLKFDHSAALHKSELGAVRVGIPVDRLAEAAYEMRLLLASAGVPVDIGGSFLVQELVEDSVETLVGVSTDPTFGQVLTVGIGGTWVELLDEAASCVMPATREDLLAAVRATKLGPVLERHRQGPRDVESLATLMVGLQQLAIHEGIVECDLNPVMVRSKGAGCVVVDTRMRR